MRRVATTQVALRRLGVLTVALLGWASSVAAQSTNAAGPPSASQAAGGTRPTGVSFLSRAAFHMSAEHLGGVDDPRFRWDANFGGDLDLVDYTRGRLIFAANYQASLGEDLQKVDPNQGNYQLVGALTARLEKVEAAFVFHPESRHLGDRPKTQPVDWNMVGGRVSRSFLVDGTYREARADLRWTIQQSFVDYTWELDTDLRADHLIRPSVGVFAAGGVRYLGVDGTAGRGGQTGYRAEGGVRFEGSGGAIELFAGVERRIDPYPLEFGTLTWMTAGFRLLSR